MSLALFLSYGFVAIFLTVVMVLCCVGCRCHLPLRRLCVWSTRCCKCPQRTEAEEKRVTDTESSTEYTNCFSWVPFVLTCGYCCGTLNEPANVPMDAKPNVDAKPKVDLPLLAFENL